MFFAERYFFAHGLACLTLAVKGFRKRIAHFDEIFDF